LWIAEPIVAYPRRTYCAGNAPALQCGQQCCKRPHASPRHAHMLTSFDRSEVLSGPCGIYVV